MVNQQISCFTGRWEFRKGNEMDSSGKSIYNSEYGCYLAMEVNQ